MHILKQMREMIEQLEGGIKNMKVQEELLVSPIIQFKKEVINELVNTHQYTQENATMLGMKGLVEIVDFDIKNEDWKAIVVSWSSTLVNLQGKVAEIAKIEGPVFAKEFEDILFTNMNLKVDGPTLTTSNKFRI
jgi:hypothetical protein